MNSKEIVEAFRSCEVDLKTANRMLSSCGYILRDPVVKGVYCLFPYKKFLNRKMKLWRMFGNPNIDYGVRLLISNERRYTHL